MPPFFANLVLLMLIAPVMAHAVPSELTAARTWEDIPVPFEGKAMVYGSYSNGCIVGAEEFPVSSEDWEVVNDSRNRFYGHPNTLALARRLSAFAANAGFGKLIFGDMSLPGGGKLSFGHSSHQLGLDMDIRFDFYSRGLVMPASERSGWPEVDIAEMKTIDANHWTCRILEDKYRPQYMELVRAAAMDSVVNRIFVSPALKVKLCDLYDSSGQHPSWLLKVRPYTGHTAHFHVRLECPSDSQDCVAQPLTGDPTDPTGVGCAGNSLHWWLTGEDLGKSAREGVARELPANSVRASSSCKTILNSMRIVKLSGGSIRCAAVEKGSGSARQTHLRCHDDLNHRNFTAISTCRPADIEKRPSVCVNVP